MLRSVVLATIAAAVLVLTGGYFTERFDAHAAAASAARRAATPSPEATPVPTPSATPTASATPTPTAVPTPAATPTPEAPRSTAALQAEVDRLARAAGADVGVSLVELDGPDPLTWSDGGDASFVAASTYKLPLLMDEAQQLAAGTVRASDALCYVDSDYEDGWYDDYGEGTCLTRQELAARIGQQSDNTAAHILVRSIGGSGPLNAYADAHGATESAFFDPNETTANDLARLWADEAGGRAGGAAAQRWLYPLLTHTAFETGIPAGTPAGTEVVHKIGMLDTEVNDAALVTNGPNGAYVLVVLTDGPGGADGWSLVASISKTVWQFEANRR